VTLENKGDVSFKILGLTLHGDFKETPTWEVMDQMGQAFFERAHIGTIPFRVNGSSLIPFFGINDEGMKISPLILTPNQTTTLTFTGVIQLQLDARIKMGPAIVVTPIVDDTYTIRLMDEGFQTFSLTAMP